VDYVNTQHGLIIYTSRVKFNRMKITRASQAIDLLGGTAEVAKIFGMSYRVVTNWRARGLPPDTYDVLGKMLRAKRHTFSPLLFAQKRPAEHPVAYHRGQPTDKRIDTP